jgi:hypothetical protein
MDKISDYAALYAMIIVIVGGAVALGLLYASARREYDGFGGRHILGYAEKVDVGVLEHLVDRKDRSAGHAGREKFRRGSKAQINLRSILIIGDGVSLFDRLAPRGGPDRDHQYDAAELWR